MENMIKVRAMRAACPPVAGFIAYYFWKWVIK